jgi:RNA-directed DNA polymerase
MPTLGRAWRVIFANGRCSQSINTRREIEEFAESPETRLTKIQRQLSRRAFKFKPAVGVAIPKKGKDQIRPLVVAPIESRIVQRAILDVLLQVPAISRIAENPYSFGGVRKRKGTEIAAVPAAIQAVLAAIGRGATYVIRSDISSFFTRIPKPAILKIVAQATREPEFMELFGTAITVELENLASLREHAAAFPIHEIGVAQGNSLSPLLGNLLLSDFDLAMNSGECCCIRYIDDFIILANDRATVERFFAEGLRIFARHGLEASPEKTVRANVTQGFTFLGIEIGNGAIRPSRESRDRLLASISDSLSESEIAFRLYAKSAQIIPSLTLTRTLSEVRGIVQGWGNHYSFCNEKNVFAQLDRQLDELMRRYLGAYSAAQKATDPKGRRHLLGVPLLEEFTSHPFVWPKTTPAPAAIPGPAVTLPAGLIK